MAWEGGEEGVVMAQEGSGEEGGRKCSAMAVQVPGSGRQRCPCPSQERERGEERGEEEERRRGGMVSKKKMGVQAEGS